MIKFKVMAFFCAIVTCAWARPQPNTVVLPRKEESLDSDIDALLQEYPDKNQKKSVGLPTSYSSTESTVDSEAIPSPSISHLSPTPMHFNPHAPEHLKTRAPRFWSRIESTTVGPHGGGFDESFNPTNYKHGEQRPVELPASYPILSNTQDQRNPAAPTVDGQASWRGPEGSVMSPKPNEGNPIQPISNQMRDLQSNPSELSSNPNPLSGGPWSWGNREGSSVNPPLPAKPFNPEYPPIDQVHFQDPQYNQDRMLPAVDHGQTHDLLTGQQQNEVSTQQQQASLSERAAAHPMHSENYNYNYENLQPYNLPNLRSHYQREAQALQSPVTRPWYMPRRANCRSIEKVVKVQQCEPYTVETCWKEARQECNPQPVTNCTGVLETKYEQVCFDVVDQLCSLLETVHTEKTEDSYQVQDCFLGHENEVCGITNQVEHFEKDDYDCTTVKVLVCHQIPQYVHDVNCIESVEFDCKEDGYQPNTLLPNIVCTQNPIKNCYKIPRKVYSEVCETIERRHCEAFSNVRAVPVEKQTCKPYTKKSCDFKIETSPKINKNFYYEVVCRSKPREICEYVEIKTVSPDCETSERLSCKYVPWSHRCKHDPKHYCHLVDKVVEEEVCDTVYGHAF